MQPGPGEHSGIESAIKHFMEGRLDQAEAAARRLQRRPDAAREATLLLARIQTESGRAQQAVFELERLRRSHPHDFDVLMLLFNAYAASRQPARAMAVSDELFRLSPSPDDTAVNIAALCKAEGKLADAERWFETARGLNPENGAAMLGLIRVYMATLRAKDGVALLRAALSSDVKSAGLFRHLSFYGQYVSGEDPAQLFDAQRIAGALVAREADGFPPRLTVDANPERQLTIAYLSPDFRTHACAHFIEPLLEARNRGAFRVIAYSTTIHADAVTARLRRLVDVWRDVPTVKDAALSHQMAADKVDIAFDLAGHTVGSRLSSLVLRPAPITATYLGYPSTTGAPGVDFRFVDAITDPPGAEALATEKLVRLDPCFLCYRPPADAPEVSAPPCQTAGHVTFGSFNAIEKISEATFDMWAKLLSKVPSSRLLLKGRAFGEQPVADRARAAFAGRSVDPGRIELIPWVENLRAHLDLYRRIDIGVDTTPYNGTTTTCEALWMGVPVVTIRGRVHAARVGASLLSAVGLPELVAEDAEGCVEAAAALAADTTKLASLRAGLRQQMASSPLRDERRFVGMFESAIRGLWRDCCAAHKPK